MGPVDPPLRRDSGPISVSSLLIAVRIPNAACRNSYTAHLDSLKTACFADSANWHGACSIRCSWNEKRISEMVKK